MAPGTLADLAAELAARSDAALMELLLARPDAMDPPAASFADLAARLGAGVDAALDGLTLDQLRTLAALRQGGGEPQDMAALHALALVMSRPTIPGHYAGPHHYILPAAVDTALAAAPVPTMAALEQPASTATRPAALKASPALVDNATAGAGAALLRTMELLVDHAGAGGLPALANGALSAVAHRRLAQALGQDERQLRFHLELAAAAGLLVHDGRSRRWWPADPESRRPLEQHGQAGLDRPAQWLHLVQSWLNSDRPPVLLDSPVPARPLAPAEPSVRMRSWRREALRARVAGPHLEGTALLAELFARRPRLTAALSTLLPALLREMELLGLTGAGVPGALGRAVAAGEWDGALAEMRRLLPPPVEGFVLQGDLTAVAPGFLAPQVAAVLKLIARQEGQGAASVHRFSRESLEAATAAGLNGPDILDFLHRHSSTAVPQALEFIVREAARTAAEAGPTCQAAAPATARPARKRGAHTPPAWPAAPPGPGNGVVRRLAQEQLKLLRSKPDLGGDGRGESGPALVVEGLRRALATGTGIRLHTVNGMGEVAEVLVEPLSLEAGTLRARDLGTGRERRFSIHRIALVEDAPPSAGTTSERQPHG